MRKSFIFNAVAALLFSATAAQAFPKGMPNYVEFHVRGDCGLEDCIAAYREAVAGLSAPLYYLDLTALGPHQKVDYKVVKITFRDLKTAPYGPVMQKFADLGYQVISYIIHDLRSGKDVIIPH